jgi:transposase-like protein
MERKNIERKRFFVSGSRVYRHKSLENSNFWLSEQWGTYRLKCPSCKGFSIKYGKNKRSEQRYRCKYCLKTFLLNYSNRANKKDVDVSIKDHLKEGCGIRSISRLLKIGVKTVLRRIKAIAKQLPKPLISFGKEYKIDDRVLGLLFYLSQHQILISIIL